MPPVEIRQLRDLTRHRVKLVQDRHRVGDRIHKVLEDASLKLSTVASDILGATGRKIIEAIIAGKTARTGWPLMPREPCAAKEISAAAGLARGGL